MSTVTFRFFTTWNACQEEARGGWGGDGQGGRWGTCGQYVWQRKPLGLATDQPRGQRQRLGVALGERGGQPQAGASAGWAPSACAGDPRWRRGRSGGVSFSPPPTTIPPVACPCLPPLQQKSQSVDRCLTLIFTSSPLRRSTGFVLGLSYGPSPQCFPG